MCCEIGDQVLAPCGCLPLVGKVVHIDAKTQKTFVRFSDSQQDWYSKEALAPFPGGKA